VCARKRSRPLMVELEVCLREQRAKLSRNNDTTKAINYCLSRWDAFSRFLDDGRLCMSAAERELRGGRHWEKELDLRRAPTRCRPMNQKYRLAMQYKIRGGDQRGTSQVDLHVRVTVADGLGGVACIGVDCRVAIDDRDVD
jgi:hypothetical protein